MTEKKTESPFIRAATIEKRAKILFFGPYATWKSRLGLDFPAPVVIDMEKGTELYGEEFEFHVINTTDPDEVMSTIDWLLNNEHPYKTLIIDPITIYWAALQDKWRAIFFERKQGKAGWKFDYYEIQPGDWVLIKAEFKRLMRKVMMLDMNVIVTAHQKKEYSDGEMMKVIGETFDGEKGLGHFFDTVVQTFRSGDKYMARTTKDRTYKLPDGEFELNYEVFVKSFGLESLNKEVVTVKLVSPEQIKKIEEWYINPSKPTTPTGRRALLNSYKVDSEQELTEEQANEILGKFEDAYQKRQEKKDAGS